MASDLCLLSLVLLDRTFRKRGLRAAPIGTVHDAINFEVPLDELDVVLPLIKKQMENPPLEKLFGYQLQIPIVADIGVGRAWSKSDEVPAELFQSQRALREWIDEHQESWAA